MRATSGSLAHDASVSLVTVTGPVVQTSQVGTVLYLQSQANGHTARIGLDTAWGGAIVEVSSDGTNFVNRHDTGRLVQVALYDGAAQYPAVGPGSVFGWEPNMGGDAYNHGSSVLQQTVTTTSLFTRTDPLHWWPDTFGGGSSMPIASDMTIEQTVTLAPGAPLAFDVHYLLIHNGTDTHYNTTQAIPAVYVNSTYTTFAYYGGASPWTYGGSTAMPTTAVATNYFTPELWAALVDTANQGLAVYFPGEFAFTTVLSFLDPAASTGPFANGTVTMIPAELFTIGPGAVIEAHVYLVPGDMSAARDAIYAIHRMLSPTDICAPFGNVDQPTPNATVSGIAGVTGWAFDNVAMSGVSVYLDGALVGAATLGGARPDVANAYPHVAPADSGWNFTLDTTKLPNGPHTIVVHAIDTASNEAILAPAKVIVSN